MVMPDKNQTDQHSTINLRARQRLSQTDVPAHPLADALRIPRALKDEYAMQPATPVEVGRAIGIKPTSGGFRSLTGAAIAYGLTIGGYNASEIALTEIGRRVVAPTEDGDDAIALREAFQRPRVLKEFVQKYSGSRFPRDDIADNVLVDLGVPPDSAARVRELIAEGAKALGLLTEINGAYFFDTHGAGRKQTVDGTSGQAERATREGHEDDDRDTGAAVPETRDRDDSGVGAAPIGNALKRPSAIFLGHGKNRKPLEQLIRVLDEWGIPHKQAIYEANAGRPIPQKVAEVMRGCGAAILIFTADEELKTPDGETIWRPSENVIHELGAAGVLYDNRIIVFKETGVTLASNFASIGYIEFEPNQLDSKVFDLLRELRHFEIISIQVAAS